MMIAYLILAHGSPRSLQLLVTRLRCENARFFIHIDRKSDMTPFEELDLGPHAKFMKPRYRIYWGGFNMVEATLDMIERALHDGADRVVLLSGACCPLLSAQEICERHSDDRLFIDASPVEAPYQNNSHTIRFDRYHLIDHEWLTPKWHGHLDASEGPAQEERQIKSLRAYIASMLTELTPPLLKDFVFCLGSQWWCLPRDALEYVLRFWKTGRADVQLRLRFSYCPDETIIQSILYNSPLRSRIAPSPWYVDWSRKGKVLDMRDLDSLRRFDGLFFRKFDPETTRDLLEALDRR